jgi:hypothetical protein
MNLLMVLHNHDGGDEDRNKHGQRDRNIQRNKQHEKRHGHQGLPETKR